MFLSMQRILIILPAFNESTRIEAVIKKIKSEGYTEILVVNDGSKDDTAEIARKAGAKVVSHLINRGTGAATQTGIEYARLKDYDIAVTLDADGQHDPGDIKKLITKLRENNLDIVFGSRFLNHNEIPFLRKMFNKLANLVTFFASSIRMSDSQTGLKAMNRKAMETIQIKTDGFEFCTEIIMQINSYKLKYGEIPAKVYYSKDTMSKGQSFATGIITVTKLFIQALSR